MKIGSLFIVIIILATSCTKSLESGTKEPNISDIPMVTENVSESGKNIYEQIKKFDYRVNVFEINHKTYDVETDKIYKEAFLNILKNKSPLKNGEYFYDYLPRRRTDDNSYFNAYVKHSHYQYFDFDSDGLPELIVYLNGVHIFKYLQEENQVYLHYSDSEYSKVLGFGQVYYHMGTSANRLQESFKHSVNLDTYPYLSFEDVFVNILEYKSVLSAQVTKVEWKAIFEEAGDEFQFYLTVNREKDYHIGGYWSGVNFELNENSYVSDAPENSLATLSTLWTGMGQWFYIYQKSDVELVVMNHPVIYPQWYILGMKEKLGDEEYAKQYEEYKEVLSIPIEKGSKIQIEESVIIIEPEVGVIG